MNPFNHSNQLRYLSIFLVTVTIILQLFLYIHFHRAKVVSHPESEYKSEEILENLLQKMNFSLKNKDKFIQQEFSDLDRVYKHNKKLFSNNDFSIVIFSHDEDQDRLHGGGCMTYVSPSFIKVGEEFFPANLENLFYLSEPEEIGEYFWLINLDDLLNSKFCGGSSLLYQDDFILNMRNDLNGKCFPKSEVNVKSDLRTDANSRTFVYYSSTIIYKASVYRNELTFHEGQIEVKSEAVIECEYGVLF